MMPSLDKTFDKHKEVTKLGVTHAIGNVVLAPRVYENWAEVVATTIKRQEPARLVLKDGVTIEAEVGLRFVVREIFFKRVYNPSYLSIGPDDVVVDIGANNGVFTLFAATHTRNAVHAYEPSPRNLEILERNIAANNFHQVFVHGSAVSDRQGFAKLHLNPADGQQNLLTDHILPEKIERFKTRSDLNYLISDQTGTSIEIEVPTTTLVEIMDSNRLDHIDFLKLDCEGAEGSILQSTPGEYLLRVSKIAMEFHDHLSELNHDGIQGLLQSAGFTTRMKWNGKSPLGYLYAWQ